MMKFVYKFTYYVVGNSSVDLVYIYFKHVVLLLYFLKIVICKFAVALDRFVNRYFQWSPLQFVTLGDLGNLG